MRYKAAHVQVGEPYLQLWYENPALWLLRKGHAVGGHLQLQNQSLYAESNLLLARRYWLKTGGRIKQPPMAGSHQTLLVQSNGHNLRWEQRLNLACGLQPLNVITMETSGMLLENIKP